MLRVPNEKENPVITRLETLFVRANDRINSPFRHHEEVFLARASVHLVLANLAGSLVRCLFVYAA